MKNKIQEKIMNMTLREYIFYRYEQMMDLTPGRYETLDKLLSDYQADKINLIAFRKRFELKPEFLEILEFITNADNFEIICSYANESIPQKNIAMEV